MSTLAPSLPAASARMRHGIRLCSATTSIPADIPAVSIAHYADYLCMLHQIVRASMPLMELAIRHCDPDNPVHRRLAAYLEEHLDEERGHAELLIEDLRVAGMAPADVLARAPLPAIVQLVGAQYYWIMHHSPLALLGYMGFLEGQPPTERAIAFWRETSGLPPAAFASLELHARADLEHRRELDRLVDNLALTADQLEIVTVSGMLSARLAGEAWDSLLRRWSA
jgi:pyrroloquinoline quinone (PQQ) biosynthesis protein C